MAWIELHQSLWTHRKTLILAGYLGIEPIYAAAHMAHLWCWALDNAQDGNLSGLPPAVIAYGAGWRGDPEQFVRAAVAAGFLDQDGDTIRLHDWEDYAGRLIEQRERHRQRARQQYARRLRAEKAQTAVLPNLTIPNQEESNEDPIRAPAGETAAGLDQAEEPKRSEPPPQLRELQEFIEQNRPRWWLQRYVAEQIVAWTERVGPELVLMAVKEAVRNNADAWSYVETILESWVEAGITTPTAAAEHIEARRRRREEGARRQTPQPSRDSPRAAPRRPPLLTVPDDFPGGYQEA